jgi:Zn-dependent protease with chaperone function
VLLAAHFSRVDLKWIALLCLLFPLVLMIKKRWVLRAFQLFLLLGAGIWVQRMLVLRGMRVEAGERWLTLVLILSGVALFTLISALVLEKKRFKERYAG